MVAGRLDSRSGPSRVVLDGGRKTSARPTDPYKKFHCPRTLQQHYIRERHRATRTERIDIVQRTCPAHMLIQGGPRPRAPLRHRGLGRHSRYESCERSCTLVPPTRMLV